MSPWPGTKKVPEPAASPVRGGNNGPEHDVVWNSVIKRDVLTYGLDEHRP